MPLLCHPSAVQPVSVRMQAAPPPGQRDDELTPAALVASLIDNTLAGEVGRRGEAWVAAQAVLIGGVIAAPEIPAVSAACRCVGCLSLSLGLLLASAGAYELGTSLSPWPQPVGRNELRTSGVYELCRHPMYAGFLLDCAGVGMLTASSERLVLTLALYCLFNAKARREEDQLEEMHGDAFVSWASRVPRFVPTVSGLRELPRLLGISESSN
ncbi:hypothetical protein AB1Y20_011396 [Prymnesium parvum]|uniref:Protein-S-isoprenylcysteine O-methyltransferase n=1 Tax=Prymnesium parvum TaxID=97485 RepID=A0AB34INT1_PRYPA